jgi:hypothetical protein
VKRNKSLEGRARASYGGFTAPLTDERAVFWDIGETGEDGLECGVGTERRLAWPQMHRSNPVIRRKTVYTAHIKCRAETLASALALDLKEVMRAASKILYAQAAQIFR